MQTTARWTLWTDLGDSCRSLLRRPALPLLAVASLALGIGANAALFSVADAVLLTPLPYADSDRLVEVVETLPGPNGQRWTGSVSWPNLSDWRSMASSIESIGAWRRGSVNLTSEGPPERARAVAVSPEIFPMLGVQAMLGDIYRSASAAPDGRAVVLSHGLWQSRNGADPSVVGSDVELDGRAHRVLGVMPPEFTFPPRLPVAVWLPLRVEGESLIRRDDRRYSVLGRLAPGRDVAAAGAELESIAARLVEEYPAEQAGRGAQVQALFDSIVGDARPVLLALWGAVGFVLLIACANVAHLLLVRSARRRRELAIRAALGADRGRLAALLVGESLLVAALAGTAGLALGRACLARISHQI
ncbi:MAG: ABC transporter permease [Thermoanaerobaculia bacterium]|nr:ABC transporter permease [Thermoanaerobaculia bacterium]